MRVLLATLLAAHAAVALAQTVIAPPSIDKAVILVSPAQAREPEVRQAVVLVAPAPNGGHVGLLLNRPTRRSLQSLFPADTSMAAVRENVYYGGPASKGALLALAKSSTPSGPGPGSLEILPGVFMVFRAATIDRVIAETPNDARYYVGYMAWQRDALKTEVEQGRWIVANASAEAAFRGDTEGMWEEFLIGALGPDHPDAGPVVISVARKALERGLHAEAERILRGELALREQRLGRDDYRLTGPLNMLGVVVLERGNFADAEQCFKRALAILEKTPDVPPKQLEVLLGNLVDLYARQNRAADAAPYAERLRAMSARNTDAR